MIVLNNITKDYKMGKEKYNVLKNISLTFEDKEFVSVLGPSGCGKTTLLNILGALDKQSSGQFLINGDDTIAFSSRDWDAYRNNCVGFVFQKFNLIEHLSVYANVELAVRLSGVSQKERRKRVMEALEKVGLQKFYRKRPTRLSGGEQQRVAIARAIVNNPDVILADEPTGSLDSKNSDQIMEILKELSKDHLVVLVTHNEEIANQYSDRIIRIKDGEILETVKREAKIQEKKKISKVHMSIPMAFSLSVKNIYSKLVRTCFTILAGCLGIIAVALVISVSEGVTTYINDIQAGALEDYPIIIRSSTITTASGNILNYRKEYPNTDKITATTMITNYEQINNIDPNFVSYIDNIDDSKYTILNYNRTISMRLLTKLDNSYYMPSTSYFTELIDDADFILTQYDVIAGQLPKDHNEIALVVDRYNCISASILSSLRMSSTQEEYTYEDILKTTYKLVENKDYYYYDEVYGRYRAYGSSSYESIYQKSPIELKITAIIREKPNCSFSLYGTGMVYTTKLTDYILERANSSSIVMEQKQYGLTKDVLTGVPFERSSGSTYSYSEEYQYDNNMLTYGAVANITRINIYSQTFSDRLYIENYIKGYEAYRQMSNISYSDYMSNLTKELTAFIDVVSEILLILALISLLVSSIMIAVITHISVIERTKEIGVLRSIGARKLDILLVFCSETVIIGLASGLFGMVLAYFVRDPINVVIQSVIKENVSLATSVTKVNLIEFDTALIVMMVLGSALLTLISGFIPAIFASLKKPVTSLRGE